ncbi:unnamed protein product [Amoebophrya sp. A120]|nr:unnamed protein product [Amoebophrya sp. A120]|eukprot:GSA120T00020216001.1
MPERRKGPTTTSGGKRVRNTARKMANIDLEIQESVSPDEEVKLESPPPHIEPEVVVEQLEDRPSGEQYNLHEPAREDNAVSPSEAMTAQEKEQSVPSGKMAVDLLAEKHSSLRKSSTANKSVTFRESVDNHDGDASDKQRFNTAAGSGSESDEVIANHGETISSSDIKRRDSISRTTTPTTAGEVSVNLSDEEYEEESPSSTMSTDDDELHENGSGAPVVVDRNANIPERRRSSTCSRLSEKLMKAKVDATCNRLSQRVEHAEANEKLPFPEPERLRTPEEAIAEAKKLFFEDDQLMVAGYLLDRTFNAEYLERDNKDPQIKEIVQRFQLVSQVRSTLAQIERGRIRQAKKAEEAANPVVQQPSKPAVVVKRKSPPPPLRKPDALQDAPQSNTRKSVQIGLEDAPGRKSVRRPGDLERVLAQEDEDLDHGSLGSYEAEEENGAPDENASDIFDSLSDEEVIDFGKTHNRNDFSPVLPQGSMGHHEVTANDLQSDSVAYSDGLTLDNMSDKTSVDLISPAVARRQPKPDFKPVSKWRIIRETDGIRAAMRTDMVFQDPKQEDTRVYTFAIEGQCDLDLFSLLSLLNEADLWKEWCPSFMGLGLVKSEVLERKSKSNFVVRMLLKLPFPFAWRKVCFRVRGYDVMAAPENKEDAKKEVKQVILHMENVGPKEEREILTRSSDYSAENEKEYDGSQRAYLDNSFMFLTPMDTRSPTKKACYLQCVINLAPHVSSGCPEWLVNAAFRNLAFMIFEQIRNSKQIVAASVYKDRNMNPEDPLYAHLKERILHEIPQQGCPVNVYLPEGLESGAEPMENLVRVRKLLERVLVDQMAARQRAEQQARLKEQGLDSGLSAVPEDQVCTGAVGGEQFQDLPNDGGKSTEKFRETVVYVQDPMNEKLVIAQKVRVPVELPHGMAAQEAGLLVKNKRAVAGQRQEKQDEFTYPEANKKKNSSANHHPAQMESVDSLSDAEHDLAEKSLSHEDHLQTMSAASFSEERNKKNPPSTKKASGKNGKASSRRSEVEKRERHDMLHNAVFGLSAKNEKDSENDMAAWQPRNSLGVTEMDFDVQTVRDLDESSKNRGNYGCVAASPSSGNVGMNQLPPTALVDSFGVVHLRTEPDAAPLDKQWAESYLKNERRVTVANVHEGMKVRPGLHWRYEDEHWSCPFGTVLKYDLAKKFVRVEWHYSGWFSSEKRVFSHYRMQPGGYDLAIYREEEAPQ